MPAYRDQDSDKLRNAAYDYKYLLTRGYPTKASLNLVASRYMLNKREMLLLYRCVHSNQYIGDVKRKLFCGKLSGFILLVDFYNIAISTINMLRGGEVYICDDCVPRDLRGSKLHTDDHPYLSKAMKIIVSTIRALDPKAVIAIADKNVSFSFDHATRLRNELRSFGIDCSFELSPTPDSKIIDYARSYKEAAVATTDSVIMAYSSRIVPLTLYIMYSLNIKPVYSFVDFFNLECPVCFNNLIQPVDENAKGCT